MKNDTAVVKRKNSKKKKNRRRIKMLMALMIVIIAGLCVLLFFVNHKKNISYDMTQPYSQIAAADNDLTGFELQTGTPFGANLCVSDNTVPLEGIEMSDADEKACLFSLSDNNVLYANGIYDRIYPASVTKIMTAIVALKYGNLSDTVTMEAEDFALEDGSQCSNMQAGDVVTMDQLFHMLMVYSANDAAMAIARHVAGSVDAFVDLMNSEALSLGMTGTHFANPHGLHDDNHYTTVYDVYLMLNEAYKYSEFTDVITYNYYQLTLNRDGQEVVYYYDSTDKYLTGEHSIPAGVNLLGGKTGTTSQAGACLALLSQDEYGQLYVSIIMNAYTKENLYNDMDKLLCQI